MWTPWRPEVWSVLFPWYIFSDQVSTYYMIYTKKYFEKKNKKNEENNKWEKKGRNEKKEER